MNTDTKISGVRIFPIGIEKDRMIFLKDEDHLLRRFGQAEVRQVSKQDSEYFTLRAVADEIWALLEGNAQIVLIDRRAKSPTEDQVVKLRLAAEEPRGILIPPGVAYAIYAKDPARLMRICTHADGSHVDDQVLPAKDFSALMQ